MKFWKKNKKEIHTQQTTSKADALNSLRLCCDYFQRNIQTHALFEPEFETSKVINSLIETKNILSDVDVIEIINLVNDINKVDHYDGSGWFDYQIRLGYFLRLSGYQTEIVDRKMSLT